MDRCPVKNWYDVLAKNTTVDDAVPDRLAKRASLQNERQ